MYQKIIKELPSLVPADDICEFNDGNRRFKNATSTPPVLSNNHSRSRSSSCSSSSSVPTKMPAVQLSGDETKEPKVEITDSKQTQVLTDMGKSPGEVAFFKLLHAELKKASYFFKRAQQEFSIREERIREGVEIMSRPSSIMINEKWSSLAKSLYRLYKDLLLLETFAIMSYCSFSKILKKHDKVTGYKTRKAFMANMVNKASFTNYPKVLGMIRRCKSSYEEVSRHLVDEGNVDLCEDERLFINMIHRLNRQIMDKAEEEDAPGVSQLRERHKKRKSWEPIGKSSPGLVSANSTMKLKCNSKVTFSFQSFVEESYSNSIDLSSSACLSDDPDDASITKAAVARDNDYALSVSPGMKRGITLEKNSSKPLKKVRI